MNSQRTAKKAIAIFSGALWNQRSRWEAVVPLLPRDAYLLAPNPTNGEQTELMKMMAQSLRHKGRPVYKWEPLKGVVSWLTPTKAKDFEYQR